MTMPSPPLSAANPIVDIVFAILVVGALALAFLLVPATRLVAKVKQRFAKSKKSVNPK